MIFILFYTELIFNADKILATPASPFIMSYNQNSIKKTVLIKYNKNKNNK